MKKAGIISVYYQNANYGGQLQSFALPYALRRLGIDAEQICFNRHTYEMQARIARLFSGSFPQKIKALSSIVFHTFEPAIYHVKDLSVQNSLQTRINVFKQFEKQIPHSKSIVDKDTIGSIVDKYDIFICGSDVIWNAGIEPYISALGFVPESKHKIAYAPSLGTSDLPLGWYERYKKYINRLDAISVREESIAECLQSYMPDTKVYCVADPTLLLSDDEWGQFCKPQDMQEDKYILCYLLGDSIEQRRRAIELSRTLDLKLLTFPYITNNHFRKCDYNFGDIQNFSADSFDFISLIKNADLVVTDSFHAVVFSSIFHIPFIALDRTNGNQTKMGGRVRNFLELTELKHQLGTLKDDSWTYILDKIDYSKLDLKLSSIRNMSFNYLKESI